MSKFKEKIVFSVLVNLFFAFTLIIFGPYEIFIGNLSNFEFTFKDFWWMPVIVAVVYLIIMTCIFSVLPDKFCNICNILIFSFTLCCYIQAMLLNFEMNTFTGENISWSTKTVISNLIIWLVILIFVITLPWLAKKDWKVIVQIAAGTLVVMQMVALVFLLFTTKVLEEKGSYGYVSQRNMLDLSKNKNVIVFLVDFFDARTMDAILTNDPDFLDPLDGFTYFVNATSVHSRTYPSITYLLTGNICHFDKPPLEWVNEASDQSSFLPTLSKNNIDIGLYTGKSYLGDSIKKLMSNYESAKPPLSFFRTMKYLAKMILYRDLPYAIKQRFRYDSADININIFKEDSDVSEKKNKEKFQWFVDEWFYEKVIDEKVKISDNAGCFRFYHLAGPHLNLSDPVPHAIRAMEIIYEYLRQMKELDIYEQSTILIITDHGNSGGGKTLDMPHGTAVPIYFVKPSNSSDTKLRVSSAPVSHTEFIPTVLNGFLLPFNDGRTVFDIEEREERNRYYYYSALHSDEEGEIELREYLVNDDARSADSYHFTGKTWDILYSENKVSDK